MGYNIAICDDDKFNGSDIVKNFNVSMNLVTKDGRNDVLIDYYDRWYQCCYSKHLKRIISYRVVLLDINMEPMDGFADCRGR